MQSLTLARNAMATRFELVLEGESLAAMRAAGEAALDEIQRLEARLSLYRPTSEISHLNARAAREPVRVSPDVFALLQQAQRLSVETGGAFDITIGPLVRCWGFMDGTGRLPSAMEIEQARARVGMHLVHLDAENLTVQFERDGVGLDLGAIGKGYAIEQAAESLRDSGVTCALMHSGTSTVYGLGAPPASTGWKVAIEHPKREASLPPLASVSLKDEALSVSGAWGKFFTVTRRRFGHVIDPRNGQPVEGALLAAVVTPSATESDALSTALLTRGTEGHDSISRLHPGMGTLLAVGAEGDCRVESRGKIERQIANVN